MAELDDFLICLTEEGGSDLHVRANTTPLIRLHGNMIPLEVPPLAAADLERLLFEVMPKRNQKEFQETGDTDFAYELAGIARFRCNALRDRKGMGGVFRVIPSNILTVDDLHLPETVRNFCYLSKGLVLVTGPTGCGKSTTLAAMIDLINRSRDDHIITIEDPVEFVHENKRCLVTQREVHEHTLSFAKALRAALRENPDVVMVGEMRDLETTRIAIETAETGHLVFGTLHTNTAATTVDRLINQFPADEQDQIRTMLASSLKGVVSQTLLKCIGGKGRVAALEILVGNAAVLSNIRDHKTFQIPSAMQVGAKLGMVCLNDSLLRLVCEEKVSAEEAISKALDKDELKQKLHMAGITGNAA